MSELEVLLKNNKLKNIVDLINVNDKKANQYPFGPLNKSTETEIFETLVRELIKESSRSNKKISFFRNQNKEIILKKGDSQISLAELMQDVNLTQISLPKADIMKYTEIGFPRLIQKVVNNKQIIESLPPITYDQFSKSIENTNTPQAKDLKKLEYGEMLAINQYTGARYPDINKLLRDPNSLPIEKIPEMIMHIAVASNGLNKVPDINLPIVIRNQGKELLD